MNSSPLNSDGYLASDRKVRRVGQSRRTDVDLVLDVVMLRQRMAMVDRRVYRIVCGGCNCLRAAQVHRGVAGDFRAESQVASAVGASLLGDLTQQMALAMVAGAAARSLGGSRSGYDEDAHINVLVFVPCQASCCNFL